MKLSNSHRAAIRNAILLHRFSEVDRLSLEAQRKLTMMAWTEKYTKFEREILTKAPPGFFYKPTQIGVFVANEKLRTREDYWLTCDQSDEIRVSHADHNGITILQASDDLVEKLRNFRAHRKTVDLEKRDLRVKIDAVLSNSHTFNSAATKWPEIREFVEAVRKRVEKGLQPTTTGKALMCGMETLNKQLGLTTTKP